MASVDFGDIGSRVARFRKLSGLNGDELAARAGNGVTRAVLANIETGRKKDMSVTHLAAIAIALGIPFSALLFDYDKPLDESTIDLGVGDEGPGPLPIWQAINWLSGQLDDLGVLSVRDIEWTEASNQTYPVLMAMESLRREWQRAETTRREVGELQAKSTAGLLSDRDRPLLEYLEGRLSGEDAAVQKTQGRLGEMGVDVSGWGSHD